MKAFAAKTRLIEGWHTATKDLKAATRPAIRKRNHFQSTPPRAVERKKNVIKEELTTVACWRMDDIRFDFNSAFVAPAAKTEFDALKVVRDAHPGAPMSVFGHADPVGDEEYNKGLSGRRAEAIYAVLVRDSARWETLYAADG